MFSNDHRPGPPGCTEEKEHMPSVTHQTIKLSKGKHSSPESGACVMELASMLAGEPFSDHPQAVSPVIGSFLRAYNDAIGDQRRQDLYAYASKAVGSRGPADAERSRGDRLLDWTARIRTRRWTQRLLPVRLRSATPLRRPSTEAIGTHAVRAIRRHTDVTHAEVLALIDELLTIGRRELDTRELDMRELDKGERRRAAEIATERQPRTPSRAL